MLPDYLCDLSPARLREFGLTRFDRAAALRRELLALLEEYVEAAAEVEAVNLLAARGAVPKKPLQRRLDFATPVKRLESAHWVSARGKGDRRA